MGGALGNAAVGCVAEKRREWEVDDPAQGVSLWARPGSIGAWGGRGVAMAKEIVALGAVALGSLTHRGSVKVKSQLKIRRTRDCILELTIQATGMAQPGMLSLQKPSTSVRAVISKGIKRAS